MTNARASAVYRYSGRATIRVRYTGLNAAGRHSYAGAVSFPDGRRWPFRELSPPPGLVPGPANFAPASPQALDRAAICAMSWCGWCDTRPGAGARSESFQDDSLSDAAQEYGDFIDDDHGTVWKVSRSLGGRCVCKASC